MSEDREPAPAGDIQPRLVSIGERLATIMEELDAITRRKMRQPVPYDPRRWPPWPRGDL